MPIDFYKPTKIFKYDFELALKNKNKKEIEKYIQTAYIERVNLDFMIFKRELEGLDEEDLAVSSFYFTYPLPYIAELYKNNYLKWSSTLERILECDVNVNVKDWKGMSAISYITSDIGHYSFLLAKKIINRGGLKGDITKWEMYWSDRLREHPTWTVNIGESKKIEI